MIASLASNMQNIINAKFSVEQDGLNKSRIKEGDKEMGKSNGLGVGYTRDQVDQLLDNITKTMIQKNTLLDQKIEKIYATTLQQTQSLTKSI